MPDITPALFLPIRELFGRFHRRREALSDRQEEREGSYRRLPDPWGQDSRWYPHDFVPHQHNEIYPLADGAAYFADLVEQLATAHQRVTIAAWSCTPLMPLLRGERERESVLAEVLNRVSQQAEVYLLLWAGAPKLFHPETKDVEEVQRILGRRAPLVHCELDRRATFSHDHHQKAVTIDGRVAYVGGMDLTTYLGDRWDTQAHPLRYGPNWHDVQLRLRGEVVSDVERNFCQRWNASTGGELEPLPTPSPDPNWNTPAQVIRTVPAGFYPFATDGIFGIRHAILAAIRQARQYIYLENQYIWAPEVVDALIEAMNRPHDDPFRVVVVLPANAYMGKYDNDQHVEKLRQADAGRGMFETYSLWAAGPGSGLTGYHYEATYVHAKVCLIDDQWLSIGSANLNSRGLATDTEMCVQSIAPAVARDLRIRLWAEHLGCEREEIAQLAPAEVIDGLWRTTARQVARGHHAGAEPPRGQIERYDVSRSVRGRALDYVQEMTLEH